MIAERICRKIAALRLRSHRIFCAADLEFRNSFAGRDGEFYVVQLYRYDRNVKVAAGAWAFESEAKARDWFFNVQAY